MIKRLARNYLVILSISLAPGYLGAAPPLESISAVTVPAFARLAFGVQPPEVLFPVAYDGVVSDTEKAGGGHYLNAAELDLSAVPAAPADGSARDQADFETLFSLQASRTSADCARAKAEMEHSFTVFFGKITPFVSPEPEFVTVFFKNTGEDSVAAHRYLKDIYKRPRPFLRDTRLKPCIARVGGYAYPSGHAAMSRLFALILGDLVPSRRQEFLARADEAALNRVIGGVHHPTDIEAGRILANELYRNLLKTPAFSADMKNLRRYLR